jgi:hypothetical protein
MQLFARNVDTAEAPGLLSNGQSACSHRRMKQCLWLESGLPSLNPVYANTLCRSLGKVWTGPSQ